MEERRNIPRNPRRRTPLQINRRLQGQLLSWLLVLLSFGFLITGLLLKDKEFSEAENRGLTQFPKLTLSAVLDGSYLQDLGDYVADQFPARNFWTVDSLKIFSLRILYVV